MKLVILSYYDMPREKRKHNIDIKTKHKKDKKLK